MLALCGLWGLVNLQLPKVSYAKAIDDWFMVSFTFILLSLLEYTLVMNIDCRSTKDKKRKKDRKISVVSKQLLSPIVETVDCAERLSEVRLDDKCCKPFKGKSKSFPGSS